jgi:hypothetical protein
MGGAPGTLVDAHRDRNAEGSVSGNTVTRHRFLLRLTLIHPIGCSLHSRSSSLSCTTGAPCRNVPACLFFFHPEPFARCRVVTGEMQLRTHRQGVLCRVADLPKSFACPRCKALMDEVVRIAPFVSEPGLIGYECPACFVMPRHGGLERARRFAGATFPRPCPSGVSFGRPRKPK